MIYLLHFHRPYRHARHYTGYVRSAAELDRRLDLHRRGQGARLLAVIAGAGITWELAATFDGDRTTERRFKRRHGAAQYCPVCRREREAARRQPALDFDREAA